jgi:tRNA A-37 threonylcarbamoyl transferase component Bud32
MLSPDPTPSVDQGADAARSPSGGSPFVAPDPAELAPHFPQLEILELIGQGGMGAVYKARQLKLDRFVALKVLPQEWGRDPAFAERFQREARALAKLNHPHIVAVHDFGEAGGHFYLLMEFVDGANLRRLLQSGPLEPRLALQVVPQICDALQYAHEEGVIHRDVKPENILLDARGRVKIADFGLAKLVGPSRASFTLTGTHQVMGTLDYMAPEQRTRPQDVDHRADIYSLGVVFYEMLTGELPLGRFAPPSQASGVDGRVDDIVFRALEREPEKRYQRVSEVRDEVASINSSETTVPPRRVTGLPAVPYQAYGAAAALFATGLMALIQWLIGGVAIISFYNVEPPHGPDAMIPGLALFVVAAGVVLAVLVMVGAVRFRQGRNHAFVAFAALLAALPWSLGWLIGLPASIWAFITLRRADVRAAFEANLRRQLSAVTLPPVNPDLQILVRGPATALFLTALVVAVELAIAASQLVPPYFDPYVAHDKAILLWFLLGAVICACAAVILLGSIHLRRFQGYEFVVMALILAMLPWSAHVVIGLPAGAWTIATLKRPEVRAAFAARLHSVGAALPAAPPPPQPTGPFQRKARSFWRRFRSMFVSSPPRDQSAEPRSNIQ